MSDYVQPPLDPVRDAAEAALLAVHPPLLRFISDIVVDAMAAPLAEVYAIPLLYARSKAEALEREVRFLREENQRLLRELGGVEVSDDEESGWD